MALNKAECLIYRKIPTNQPTIKSVKKYID